MVQDTPSRKLDQYIVRLPDGMRDRLKDEAEKNGRSMNAEIVRRIEDTFMLEPREASQNISWLLEQHKKTERKLEHRENQVDTLNDALRDLYLIVLRYNELMADYYEYIDDVSKDIPVDVYEKILDMTAAATILRMHFLKRYAPGGTSETPFNLRPNEALESFENSGDFEHDSEEYVKKTFADLMERQSSARRNEK